MPLDNTSGLHSSFAWSCTTAKCADNENNTCTGVPFVAGTSDEGTHAYAECVQDILANPDLYADEHLTLHGTHQLTDDQILEIYGLDRGLPPTGITYTDMGIVRDGEDDDSDILAVAVDDTNTAFYVTAWALADMLTNPTLWAVFGYTLYGTHVLPEVFGGPEEDRRARGCADCGGNLRVMPDGDLRHVNEHNEPLLIESHPAALAI